MTIEMIEDNDRYLAELGKRAKAAETALRVMTTEDKNRGLLAAANAILDNKDEIIKANLEDIKKAEENGMKASMVDRLRLTDDRLLGMAEGLRQIAELPDPVGNVLEEFERPNGLKLCRVSVPMGVIGIIYESRPNVTADAFGLTFKAGSAVILKGGSDALSSNKAIVKVIREALSAQNLCEDAISLIEDTRRETATKFMKLRQYVDLLIPRGGAGLIRATVENSSIPVIETGIGNCHTYVDESADVDMAVRVIENAKTQRLGVCNACESLVVHMGAAKNALPEIAKCLISHGIEIRGDERAAEILKGVGQIVPATMEDYAAEYGDAIISVKTVDTLDEAINHINRYTTHHSECIITGDKNAADRFLREIDAACVYVNASTRFTDGFEFGFGAEIGISTQKLHARGPMGLKALTSYKYQIVGDGQVRG